MLLDSNHEYLIIVDVEATCWQGKQPRDQTSEIIEIGICLVDMTTREPLNGSARSIIVKPTRSTLSPFCTELTSITQEEVEKGILFEEACILIEKEYQGRRYPWASWGAYDFKQFSKQCQYINRPLPFGNPHVNLKQVFSDQMNLKKKSGMKGALGILGIELEGKHHRGVDDAWNIAKIASWLLKNREGVGDLLRS